MFFFVVDIIEKERDQYTKQIEELNAEIDSIRANTTVSCRLRWTSLFVQNECVLLGIDSVSLGFSICQVLVQSDRELLVAHIS